MWRGRFVLRQSRLHSGLAQVFLVLFALFAGFATASDAPSGSDARQHVSSPADASGDAPGLIGLALQSADEFEEDGDPDGLAVLAPATFGDVVVDHVLAGGGGPVSLLRLSARFGTGPPTL